VNGTTFLDETLEGVSKNDSKIKHDKIKILLAFLLSNVLVFLITQQLLSSSSTKNNNLLSKFPRKNHILIKLPIKIFVPFITGESVKEVTVINNKNQIIILKGFLHLPTKENISINHVEHTSFYTLEVPKEDFKKLIKEQHTKLSAYPYASLTKINNNYKKEIKYEIIF